MARRRRVPLPGSPPEVFVPVPLWLAEWGTCSALVAAATWQQARAIAVQRDAQLAPGRFARPVYVRPATRRDVEAFAESGALPEWCADLVDAAPEPNPPQQEALAL